MDFIKQNIKRFNLLNQNSLGFPLQFPTIEKTQVEKLQEDIYRSLKNRSQNLNQVDSNDQTFDNLIKQSKGIQSFESMDIKDFGKKFKDTTFQ